MKLFKLILASVCAATVSYRLQAVEGWNGIVPLHSTRTDVERVLGIPLESGQTSIYHLGDELVKVDYAASPCRGSLPGWNVPPDTVLQVHLIPQKRIPFDRQKFEKGKYVRAYGHVTSAYY